MSLLSDIYLQGEGTCRPDTSYSASESAPSDSIGLERFASSNLFLSFPSLHYKGNGPSSRSLGSHPVAPTVHPLVWSENPMAIRILYGFIRNSPSVYIYMLTTQNLPRRPYVSLERLAAPENKSVTNGSGDVVILFLFKALLSY